MKRTRRRQLDAGFLLLGSLVVGSAGLIGALAGDTERIGEYWTHAVVDASGSADVVEVIDYDFGPRNRRGILRNIPDVPVDAPILVSSPTAPDDLQVERGFNEVRVRIGDPGVTVRQRHRYRIEYPVALVVDGDRVRWNAVGTDWTVPVNGAEIHMTAPFALLEPRCDKGSVGTVGGCELIEVEPGHLIVNVGGLSAREGVTVSAVIGAALPSTPRGPVSPSGAADDPGTGWLPPALAATGASLVAAGAASRLIRHLGREKVWKGGPADAAFGPADDSVAGTRLVDHAELADMATIEFEAPRGMSAAAGGIVHDELVRPHHQMAWLVEAAIRGEVELVETGGDDDLALVLGDTAPHPAVAPVLAAMFGSRSRVELGSYDPMFASGWEYLHDQLDGWRAASGFWEPRGHARRRLARILGGIGLVVGLAVVVVGGVLANRNGPLWLSLALLGGMMAGTSMAALVRSWELPIRTAEGSAKWLQTESFRRFIENSEARHAEAAARMGLLRHYTAWAVALDELDHWEHAVEAAASKPDSTVGAGSGDFRFVAMSGAFSSATTQTFTAPSSSSSGGGGGGGGAGGGGGGGGGGSW